MIFVQRRGDILITTKKHTSIRKTAGLTFFLLLLIVIVAFVSHPSTLMPLLLVPLVYAIFIVFFAGIFYYIDSPGMIILNALYFVRYFPYPLLMLFYNHYYIEDYSKGIWLLLYEETICAVVLYFLIRRRQKEFINSVEINDCFSSASNLYAATLIFSVLSVGIIAINPSILLNYNIIFGLTSEKLKHIELVQSSLSVSSFDIIVLDITRLLIPASIGVSFAEMYNKTQKNIAYILSLFFAVSLSMVIMSGVDRGTVVLNGIAIGFIIYKIFPQKRKATNVIVVVSAAIIVLNLVVVRLIVSESSTGLTRYGGIERILEYIQAYVAGIKNMDITIRMKQEYGQYVTFTTPFNDLFANVPFLSRIVDVGNLSSKYFNNSYGRIGTDQIMPLIGNGLMYFGYVFSPIFSIIMLRVVFWCDEKYRSSNDVFSVFIWSYASTLLTFCHFNNLQLIMLYFSCRILPLVLVYYVFMRLDLRINKLRVR